MDEETLLGTVAALEQQSQHPIAQGIVREAKKRELPLPAISEFQSITGKGDIGNGKRKVGVVVSPGYLKEKNIAQPEGCLWQRGRNGSICADRRPTGRLYGPGRPNPGRFQRSRPAVAGIGDKGVHGYRAITNRWPIR